MTNNNLNHNMLEADMINAQVAKIHILGKHIYKKRTIIMYHNLCTVNASLS